MGAQAGDGSVRRQCLPHLRAYPVSNAARGSAQLPAEQAP